MLLSVFLSYLPYAFVTAVTPGPNNIIALHTISQNGWKKGKSTLFGIALGFFCVMLLCGLFCYELAKFVPTITGIMKYIGALYILWLAFHVAKSKPDDTAHKPVSFWSGLCLEFANVKIILYAITIFTSYVLPHDTRLLSIAAHALCMTLIGAVGFVLWGAVGGLLQKFLAKYYKPFNLTMALVLVYCALMLVLR